MGRGLYAPNGTGPEQLYAWRCEAALASMRPGVALAGPSAAFWWELPVPGIPQQITLRGLPSGAYSAGLRVLSGRAETQEHRGLLVTSPTQTVLDCAQLMTRRDALIVTDALLQAGHCSVADLTKALGRYARRRGIQKARWVVANADPLSESPGETWTRMVVRDLGYSVTSQYRVEDGEFLAFLDLLVEGGPVAIEFDGGIKYRTAPTAAVVREKIREGRLEELGYRLLRVVWPQLSDPARLAQRLAAAGVRPSRSRNTSVRA